MASPSCVTVVCGWPLPELDYKVNEVKDKTFLSLLPPKPTAPPLRGVSLIRRQQGRAQGDTKAAGTQAGQTPQSEQLNTGSTEQKQQNGSGLKAGGIGTQGRACSNKVWECIETGRILHRHEQGKSTQEQGKLLLGKNN